MNEVEQHPEKCKCWICEYKSQARTILAIPAQYRPYKYYRSSAIGMFNHGDAIMMPKPDDRDVYFK